MERKHKANRGAELRAWRSWIGRKNPFAHLAHEVEWEARVDRVAGTVDPNTQTLGVVVAVDNPYTKVEPGKRPTLTRNSFVEVELLGKPLKNGIIIPTHALHEGKVYVVDTENRLLIRTAVIWFVQGSMAVLSNGVKLGERVVISDLIPAVQGLLLSPEEDPKTKRLLEIDATGRSAEK